MKYLILAESVSGKHGKTYKKNDKITADQVYTDHIKDMISSGLISEITSPKADSKKSENEKV